MMALKIKLTKQQKQTLAAAALCVVALGYVYVAFFWIPISKKSDDLQNSISQAEAKITSATIQAEKMPRLKAEIADLQARDKEISRQLPNTESVDDILVTLGRLADRYDVSILSFAPGPETAEPYFIELRYPLVIEGQFHDIGKFFAALSLEERIFNVQNISFGAADPDSGRMQVSLTLLAYRYKA